jgi:hypothetical protein
MPELVRNGQAEPAAAVPPKNDNRSVTGCSSGVQFGLLLLPNRAQTDQSHAAGGLHPLQRGSAHAARQGTQRLGIAVPTRDLGRLDTEGPR